MRKIIFIVVVFLFVALIALRFSEIEQILLILDKADWEFVLVGIFLQALCFTGTARAYQWLYNLMNIREDLRHLLYIALSVYFVSIIAPSGGISGAAIFVNEAKKHAQPRGAVLAVFALNIFIEYISLFIMLAVGFTILLRRRSINMGEVSAALVLTFAIIIFGWLISTGVRSPERFKKFLVGTIHKVNTLLRPILHRNYMIEDQVELFANEVSYGLAFLRTERKDLLWPLVYILWNRILQTCILWMCFMSFNVDFSLGTLVAGYAIGVLFVVVTPTPAGIGFVEGGLPLVLASLRVPFEQGILVTLTYRAITFWLPLAAGAFAFRQLQRNPKPVAQ